MTLNQSRQSPRRGFTLLELLVSIAIAIVLMAGVNQLFKLSADAVGSGEALLTIVRNHRAAQAVFYSDMSKAAIADGPALVIRSERQWSFLRRGDDVSDVDWQTSKTNTSIRTEDRDGDGVEESPPNATYTDRSHRVDRFVFFARGNFPRQTGNTGVTAGSQDVYAANMSSTEAMIWYGHVKQPDFKNASAKQEWIHRLPGEIPTTANPNPDNFYASDWILGRVAILLKKAQDTSGDGYGDLMNDDTVPTPIPQQFIRRQGPGLAPLVPPSSSADGWQIQWFRYDIADTTMADYRAILENPANHGTLEGDPPVAGEPWYDSLSSSRFQANGYPTKPFSGFGSARTVPIFIKGCSQFLVEFAGDFLSQNPDGTLTASPTSPDGQVDFVVPAGQSRRIRWYGFPRNVDTSDDAAGAPMIRGTGTINQLIDVVPLHDVLTAGGAAMPPWIGFEDVSDMLPVKANYAGNASAGIAQDAKYIAAWASAASYVPALGADPPKPKMLRIVQKLEDPRGRVEGQWYEYVMTLP